MTPSWTAGRPRRSCWAPWTSTTPSTSLATPRSGRTGVGADPGVGGHPGQETRRWLEVTPAARPPPPARTPGVLQGWASRHPGGASRPAPGQGPDAAAGAEPGPPHAPGVPAPAWRQVGAGRAWGQGCGGTLGSQNHQALRTLSYYPVGQITPMASWRNLRRGDVLFCAPQPPSFNFLPSEVGKNTCLSIPAWPAVADSWRFPRLFSARQNLCGLSCRKDRTVLRRRRCGPLHAVEGRLRQRRAATAGLGWPRLGFEPGV